MARNIHLLLEEGNDFTILRGLVMVAFLSMIY